MLLMISLAFADIPPPRDYVETCTVPIQCGPDIEGQVLRSSIPDGCSECAALAEQGWVEMCSGWGGTVSDVVMCASQPEEKARQERIVSAESSGICATASLGFSAMLMLLAVLGLRPRTRPA